MSATIVTDRIYDAFRSDAEHDRTFYDGHTYCGNPITSAAAMAALDVFEAENVMNHVPALSRQLAEGMAKIAANDAVAYYKTLGMIGMVAIGPDHGGAAGARDIAARALQNGLYIRPLGNVLYLWPPLTTTAEELGTMLEIFERSVAEAP